VVSIKKLLDPQSVVVVGATNAPDNLGGAALRLMSKFGYSGRVRVVHPREKEVAGFTCYESLTALPEIPDLAILALSARHCLQAVTECAQAGIKQVIAWAGGFSEAGDDGAALQAALAEKCRAEGIAFLGPNCLGLVNAHSGLTATFAMWLADTGTLIPGGISMASQSGGMVSTAQAMAQRAGFGFRYSVSTGNEAVLTIADFIEEFVRDEPTQVIAAYIEGARDGARLVSALEAAKDAGKPVVILKAGRTAASAQAAVSHTGALAGEARVWDAVLRDTGVIQVWSFEDLVETILFLNSRNGRLRPSGRGVATVTFGGGNGVLSADQCASAGLETPLLSRQIRDELEPVVPPIASTWNPVDLTPAFLGHRWRDGLARVFASIAADPAIDSLLLQCGGPMGGNGGTIADAVGAYLDRPAGPIAVAWPLAPPEVVEEMARCGIYVCQEYARAISVLGVVTEHSVTNVSRLEASRADGVPNGARAARVRLDWAEISASAGPSGVISEPLCHEILRGAGLATAAGQVARSAEDSLMAAKVIGFPVALKFVSEKVTHRAAAGLVRLALGSDADVIEAYQLLRARGAAMGVNDGLFYVQAMVPGESELLLSAFRDPAFGLFVSCGAGGVLAESIDDVALARGPLRPAGALRLLQQLRVIQGLAKLNREAEIRVLADYVAEFSTLADSIPWRGFTFELNPVRWGVSGAVAADGLLVIEER
jgi:acyl-CoA synthetase (NDP forming)